MTDLDTMLTHIGELPLDPRLDGIDDAVFAGLAEAARPAVPRAALGAVAALAMSVGMLASASPQAPRSHADLFPLGEPGVLAPSTLLGDQP